MNGARALYINGKFLAQRTTGVQRFALGLVTALDALLVHRSELSAPILLLPPGSNRLALQRIEQRECGTNFTSATLWEQVALPWAARQGTLLCLTGSAPLIGGIRILTIHDAAIYLYPRAYSLKFVSWYRLLFKLISDSAPITLTVSAKSAADLEEFLPGRQFRVIPNSAEHILHQPADMSVLSLYGLKPQSYLLAVGSRNPTKNLDALVRAYHDSGLCPELDMVFVGGQNQKVFAKSSADFSLPGLIYTGAIEDGELRALYENALALVFPSIYEGFGIPPLEAMTCGCPVVASNASSIPEVCGDAALYFDPYDQTSMIKTLQDIAKQTNLRAALARKGYAQIKHYSWKRSAETLVNELLTIGSLTYK